MRCSDIRSRCDASVHRQGATVSRDIASVRVAGTVKDILTGPDGKMVAAVVSVDRTLGIGAKDVGVSFPPLQFEQRDNQRRIVLDATKESVGLSA